MLTHLRFLFELVSLVWADGGYAGTLAAWAKEELQLTIEIVKGNDDLRGFVVLPRRWVVECTLSWIFQRRRCVQTMSGYPGVTKPWSSGP